MIFRVAYPEPLSIWMVGLAFTCCINSVTLLPAASACAGPSENIVLTFTPDTPDPNETDDCWSVTTEEDVDAVVCHFIFRCMRAIGYAYHYHVVTVCTSSEEKWC